MKFSREQHRCSLVNRCASHSSWEWVDSRFFLLIQFKWHESEKFRPPSRLPLWDMMLLSLRGKMVRVLFGGGDKTVGKSSREGRKRKWAKKGEKPGAMTVV